MPFMGTTSRAHPRRPFRGALEICHNIRGQHSAVVGNILQVDARVGNLGCQRWRPSRRALLALPGPVYIVHVVLGDAAVGACALDEDVYMPLSCPVLALEPPRARPRGGGREPRQERVSSSGAGAAPPESRPAMSSSAAAMTAILSSTGTEVPAAA